MTQNANPLRKDHLTNGTATDFLYDWQIDSASELLVTKINLLVTPNTEEILNTGFTVSGVGNAAGGNVIISPAFATGYKIILTSDIPFNQTANFTDQNSVKPVEVMGMGDRLSRQIKKLAEQVSRAVLTNFSDSSTDPNNFLNTVLGYLNAAEAAADSTAADVITTAGSVVDAQNWATAAQSAATGINWTKARVASTVNVNIAAPGASIDGVALAAGQRVLLKNQTTTSQNGLYVWNGAATAMTRATDADTWLEIVSKVVQIEEGTVNADLPYMFTVNTGGTIGVTAITVVLFQSPLVIASQAEAEAGTENTKAMSALRTRQAIQAYPRPTRQFLTSGTTYTTPANCKRIEVYMVGAGGGGGGYTGSAGGDGGDTSFNSVVAKGGKGGGLGFTTNTAAGEPGTGGTGTATARYRGGPGHGGSRYIGGGGGDTVFFGGGGHSGNTSYTGATDGDKGGGGAGAGTATNDNTGGKGGGPGESVLLIINNPAASYTYALGTAGTAGTSATAGGPGYIEVVEYY